MSPKPPRNPGHQLDLNFCTPFQHFLQKVVFLRETSSLCYMKKSICLESKHQLFQKVSDGCAKNEVKLMSKVLGRLWGHLGGSGRVFGNPKVILVSPRVQNEAWGRLWEGFGKLWEGFGSSCECVRPSARPIIYTNSRSTAPAAPY